jgi:hypothetical protein
MRAAVWDVNFIQKGNRGLDRNLVSFADTT